MTDGDGAEDAAFVSAGGSLWVIFREVGGRARRVTLTLAGRRRKVSFGKYQIRSFLLRTRGRKVASIREVDLMERPI